MPKTRHVKAIAAFILAVLATAACGVENGEAPSDDSNEGALTVGHTFDFASRGPSRLSIMFTMAWFGVDSSDPQSPVGADPSYGNWNAGATPCSSDPDLANPPKTTPPDPSQSDTCIELGKGNACIATGAPQRRISSRRRPLTGIWSGTGRDQESDRKIDLMLSMLRRPGCRADDGAKFDAWTMQNNSIKFSSKYVANPSKSADFPYRTMMTLFARADAAGILNAIIPGFDETFYGNFGTSFGLGKCDGSVGNPLQNCIDAIEEDIRDMVLESKKHPSALKVAGKPVIFVYTDDYNLRTPRYTDWRDKILPWARAQAGTDFYVIGVDSNPLYFNAFDVLAPWLASSAYVNASGTSVYADSYAHAVAQHEKLVAAVQNYPGRLVFGGVTPGFDDWTRNWRGPCQERQMPSDSPRDPAFLTAQSDFFASCKAGTGCVTSPSKVTQYDFRGFLGETWDDWTEGSEFEPDVKDGPDRLVRLRGLIGRQFGDAYPDTAGDARLAARWNNYGQARTGSGAAAGTPPVTNLACDSTNAVPLLVEPQNGATVTSPVVVQALDESSKTAVAMQVYLDDVMVFQMKNTESLVASITTTTGSHRIAAKSWYADGTNLLSAQATITVK